LGGSRLIRFLFERGEVREVGLCKDARYWERWWEHLILCFYRGRCYS
jgi:hypothetical protein